MGGACSKHGSDEKYIQNLKGRDHVEAPEVDRKIILKYML
jgi:hypothetical protein